MAITLNHGRQTLLVATMPFTFADVVSGTYAPMINLPAGAIVQSGNITITTIFNSGTDDKFSIGHKVGTASAVDAYYAAQSADVTTAPTIVPAVATAYKYLTPSTVGVVWTATGGAATAGAGRLTVTYILADRATETQP